MLQEAQAVGEGLGDEMLCRERRMEKHHCTKHVSKEAIVGADPPAPAILGTCVRDEFPRQALPRFPIYKIGSGKKMIILSHSKF